MQCTNNDPFQPLFWPDRLDQPGKVKKPSRIFVSSMGDLFGDWVPDEWIVEVLDTVRGYSWHTYQFLTKNPKRLKDFNPWPKNAWVGTTVTNQTDADERLPWLLKVNAPIRFVSHDPLLSGLDLSKWVRPDEIVPDNNPTGWGRNYCGISWAIIGSMTGSGSVKVKDGWVSGIVGQYWAAGVPVFLKDNLYRESMGWTKKIQEFPA